MRTKPEGIESGVLTGSLADGWNIDVEALRYAAVGAGSYHWIVHDRDRTRRFVTVDDLDQKTWLGDTRETVLGGLRRAFETAVALRDGGLGFVVAPIPTNDGEAVRRLGPRHTIAVFPFVEGRAGRFGDYDDGERAAVVTMLAELHAATPGVASVARTIGLEVPGRGYLEAGLRELDRSWEGGPFSEPARWALSRHVSDVTELLALADRLSADVAGRAADWVVTHGEPHAGNVMRTAEGHLLVDWDTVALAPPERDLWMVVDGSAKDMTSYTDATGHIFDRVAVDFYRLTWDLNDLAAYIHELRSPHGYGDDTVMAYEGLTRCVSSRARWDALLG
jgi:spectinomycin phosphotransferase